MIFVIFLVEDAEMLVSGVTPCLPAASASRLGGGGVEGPICSCLALLWYTLNPLFCEHARLNLRATGKFFFVCFVSVENHSFGCYLMLVPSDCPRGIQARSDDAAWPQQAPGLLLHWQRWLGTWSVVFLFFVFFPPGYVALWDSKTPHRPTVETSPSQLPPQDRYPSLNLLSLFLSFMFCPTSFQREWVAFLGA